MPIAHSRQIATAESVAQACDQLFRAGQTITARAVREVLKGGHVPVVYRFIREWEKKHRQQYLMMEAALDLDSPAVRVLTAVWDAAHTAAQAAQQENADEQ